MIFDAKRIAIKLPHIRAAIPSFSRQSYKAKSNNTADDRSDDKLKAQFHRDLHDVMLRDPEMGTPSCRLFTHKSKGMKIKRALRAVSNSNVKTSTDGRDVA